MLCRLYSISSLIVYAHFPQGKYPFCYYSMELQWLLIALSAKWFFFSALLMKDDLPGYTHSVVPLWGEFYCRLFFIVARLPPPPPVSNNSTALSVLRREGKRRIKLAWRSWDLSKEQKEILRVSSPSERLCEWRVEARLSARYEEKSEGTERGRGEEMMEGE